MNASEHNLANIRQEASDTILWLTGWSMPDTVFDRLRLLVPDFHHISVNYSDAGSLEHMLLLTETAANNKSRGQLLLSGWSLGGLLALRCALAVKGFVDGLVLFAATARFTRPKEEYDLGWADAYVRQMIAGLSKDRQAVETKFRRLLFTDAEWEAGLRESLPPTGSWTTPALIAGLQILRSEDILSRLPAIDCPVLLVHGTEDKICPYGAALELAAQLPQAELLALPACGHAPFVGREAFLAEQLRRWWHEQQEKRNSAPI